VFSDIGLSIFKHWRERRTVFLTRKFLPAKKHKNSVRHCISYEYFRLPLLGRPFPPSSGENLLLPLQNEPTSFLGAATSHLIAPATLIQFKKETMMPYPYQRPQLCTLAADGDPVVVKIPFAMKDPFKRAFPSAWWDPSMTAWNVPGEYLETLNDWIVEQQGTFEQVLAEYDALKSDYEAAQAERAEAEARARVMREIEKNRRQAALASGEAEFASHAPVEEACAAFEQVLEGADVPRAWARQVRNEGRATLVEIQNALRVAGIQSKGIQELRSYNMNRLTKAEASCARKNLFVLEPYVTPSEDDD
jgi:hypothetical protein